MKREEKRSTGRREKGSVRINEAQEVEERIETEKQDRREQGRIECK